MTGKNNWSRKIFLYKFPVCPFPPFTSTKPASLSNFSASLIVMGISSYLLTIILQHVQGVLQSFFVSIYQDQPNRILPFLSKYSMRHRKFLIVSQATLLVFQVLFSHHVRILLFLFVQDWTDHTLVFRSL